MLASLLPGLRDLRVPLSVGYMWLLAAWLLMSDEVPRSRPQDGGTVDHIYELGEIIGRPGVLAAVSFIAYLLGSFLLFSPQRAAVTLRAAGVRGRTLEEFAEWIKQQSRTVNHTEVDQIGSGQSRRFETKLMVANERLHGDFDRLRSEAELRVNVALPLLVLSVILAAQLNWFFAFGGLVSVILCYQGLQRARAAQEVVLQALMAGVIDTDVGADLRAAS